MAQKRPNQDIPLQEIANTLEQGVAGADPLRADNLAQLTTVRQVKSKGQQRELKRLQQKYGNNHPRVQVLEQKLAVNQVLVKTLDIETKRARVDFPIATKDTWILHGYVYQQRLQERVPLVGVNVVVAEPSGKPIEEVGFACTDKTGYFQLKYPPDKTKGTKKPARNGTQLRPKPQAEASTAIDILQVADPDQVVFFAQVLDRKGTLLHSDDQPINPELGQVDYLEIIVGEPPCPSPFDDNDKPKDLGDWIIRGRVTQLAGDQERPLAGVMVSAFDADERFDDKLGAALTLKDGNFEIRYRQHDFAPDSEKGSPDLYVTITDLNGKEIYSSRTNIRTNAKREEAFQIVIRN